MPPLRITSSLAVSQQPNSILQPSTGWRGAKGAEDHTSSDTHVPHERNIHFASLPDPHNHRGDGADQTDPRSVAAAGIPTRPNPRKRNVIDQPTPHTNPILVAPAHSNFVSLPGSTLSPPVQLRHRNIQWVVGHYPISDIILLGKRRGS
jgi:hypothetical protein